MMLSRFRTLLPGLVLLALAGFGFLANALSLENTFAVAIPAVHITVIG